MELDMELVDAILLLGLGGLILVVTIGIIKFINISTTDIGDKIIVASAILATGIVLGAYLMADAILLSASDTVIPF